MNNLWLIDLLKGIKIRQWHDFLQNSQWWTQEQIDEYQNQKFLLLIRHVYENVEYYNNLFKKLNLSPNDFKSLDDIVKIPLLRKQNITENFSQFKANNFTKFNPVIKRTGGSTGEPLVFYNDKSVRAIEWALKYRAWSWGGYKVGDKIAVMGGASLFPKSKKKISRIMWQKLNNFYSMSSVHLNKDMAMQYAQKIIKNKISYIRGYPSSIASFATFIK
jgi:phenylacetate-CoA ligase